MESIEKQIEKQLNIIIDRYEKLKVSFKDLRKYLTGKNIKTVIDELNEFEEIYLRRYKDKNGKDFKILVKKNIIDILKDRSYAYMDKNESMVVKMFEDFKNIEWDDWDDYEEEKDWNDQRTLTVKELKHDLEEIIPMDNKMKYRDKIIKFDFDKTTNINMLMSWRGKYNELTLDNNRMVVRDMTLNRLLFELKTCSSRSYSGYKGGTFNKMNMDTPVWADPWGQCGRRMIIGVEDTSEYIILKTKMKK